MNVSKKKREKKTQSANQREQIVFKKQKWFINWRKEVRIISAAVCCCFTNLISIFSFFEADIVLFLFLFILFVCMKADYLLISKEANRSRDQDQMNLLFSFPYPSILVYIICWEQKMKKKKRKRNENKRKLFWNQNNKNILS